MIGALWNGADAPPESMDGSGQNNIKSIHSRSGVVVTFDDTGGQERLHLKTPGGQEIELLDAGPSVEVRDASGNRVVLESAGITVSSSGTVTVQASSIDVTAGSVSVNAGISKFSGVIQADTVITNSVVSSSYTPGAGNIW